MQKSVKEGGYLHHPFFHCSGVRPPNGGKKKSAKSQSIDDSFPFNMVLFFEGTIFWVIFWSIFVESLLRKLQPQKSEDVSIPLIYPPTQ